MPMLALSLPWDKAATDIEAFLKAEKLHYKRVDTFDRVEFVLVDGTISVYHYAHLNSHYVQVTSPNDALAERALRVLNYYFNGEAQYRRGLVDLVKERLLG